jgi:hypothetical protein
MARPYLILKRYNIINKGSDYKLDNVTSKHCPNCYELLFKETNKDIDYPYVCLCCDENFYNIELEDKNILSKIINETVPYNDIREANNEQKILSKI